MSNLTPTKWQRQSKAEVIEHTNTHPCCTNTHDNFPLSELQFKNVLVKLGQKSWRLNMDLQYYRHRCFFFFFILFRKQNACVLITSLLWQCLFHFKKKKKMHVRCMCGFHPPGVSNITFYTGLSVTLNVCGCKRHGPGLLSDVGLVNEKTRISESMKGVWRGQWRISTF